MNTNTGREKGALLTEVYAADFLSLSTRTLQAWRIRGVGPSYVRAGRAIRYRLEDLVAWASANTVKSNDPALRRASESA